MCKAFSCIVTKRGKVIWRAGVDSHDQLISDAKLKDDTTDGNTIQFAKVEVTPDEGYLHPEGKWTLKVENTTPRWWNAKKVAAALEACEEWKQAIYPGINLAEALNPIHPFKLPKHEVTAEDIALLKKWDSVRASVWDSVGASVQASVGASVWDSVWASVGASVWDSVWDSVRASVGASVWASVRASVRASVWASVGASVWASVWDSVRDSVWDSVYSYIGSLFTGIKVWKYVKGEQDGYPFQPCIDLWKRGMVASFDGTTWCLHSGEKAEVVYQITAKELKEMK